MMEYAATDNLEHVLSDTAVRPQATKPPAERTDDRFAHHLQPPTAHHASADQPTEEVESAPAREDVANEEAAPSQTTNNEDAEAGDSSSGTELIDNEATAEAKQATPDTQPQNEVVADPTAPQSVPAQPGQHDEQPHVPAAASAQNKDVVPNAAIDQQPQRDAQQVAATQGSEQGQPEPVAEMQSPHTPAQETPETARHQKSENRNRGTAAKTGAPLPGHEPKPSANRIPEQQAPPSPQWVELPESQPSRNQSPSTGTESRTTAEAESVARDARVDAVQGRMRDVSAARQTNRAGESFELNRIEQARLVQRVSRAIQVAHVRGGPLRLRLSPPELGSLRLEVTVEKGVMSAKVEADSQMARSVLLENLPLLRDRLSEQGVQLEKFDVDVSDRPPDDTQRRADDKQDTTEPSAEELAADIAPPDDAESVEENRLTLAQGKLNVVV